MDWIPGFAPDARPSPESRVFAFADGRLAVGADGEVPRVGELPGGLALLHVGELDGAPAFAAVLESEDGLATVGLRDLLGQAPDALAAAAGRAAQVVEWERGHAFCGRCGAATEPTGAELARACPGCGAVYYPRITPAVIMAVHRGDRLLLARRPGPNVRWYSVLAGFVEAGETLEQAVVREVREEVGIEIGDVRYFGSQPWPFPSQLMVGFTAEHVAGELAVDEAELADAGWYAAGELPPVPGGFTIARRLIDDFVARTR